MDRVYQLFKILTGSKPTRRVTEDDCCTESIPKSYCDSTSHHVEQRWRDYENFENSVSRALPVQGLSIETRERKKYVDEIDWNLLAVPPSGSVEEELQWTAWKKSLAFEKYVSFYPACTTQLSL